MYNNGLAWSDVKNIYKLLLKNRVNQIEIRYLHDRKSLIYSINTFASG